MKVIKRYQNRKMYDPQTHKYIGLKDVFEMVKNGETLLVRCGDKDITNKTLMKAFVEFGNVDQTTIEELIKYEKPQESYPF